jgi:hypothetical protein
VLKTNRLTLVLSEENYVDEVDQVEDTVMNCQSGSVVIQINNAW